LWPGGRGDPWRGRVIVGGSEKFRGAAKEAQEERQPSEGGSGIFVEAKKRPSKSRGGGLPAVDSRGSYFL